MAPQLNKDQAKIALNEIVDIFAVPANKQKLIDTVTECNNIEDPNVRMLERMKRFSPLVTGMVKDVMDKYGFKQSEVMAGIIQIQAQSVNDPDMCHKVQLLMNAFQGNFEGVDSAGDAESAEEEVEICD